MNYEFKIKILNKAYLDQLVISLAHQGYAPYITEDTEVGITISEDELTQIKE